MDGIPNKILTFDIETIPDYNAAYELGLLARGFSQEEAEEALQKRFNSAFLPCLLHRVVAIGMLKAVKTPLDTAISNKNLDSDPSHYLSTEYVRVAIDKQEYSLIEEFFNSLKDRPILVSYNGTNFDLPVLKARARKLRVQAPFYYSGESKWESYTARYTSWHCDLLEECKDTWNKGLYRLDDLAAMLGLPGKLEGVNGASVKHLFAEEDFDTIEEYCTGDVVITYLIYLVDLYHKGDLSAFEFKESIESLKSAIRYPDLIDQLDAVPLL